MGMYKVLRHSKTIIGGDGQFGIRKVYQTEKEYDDYDALLADLPKYKDKIGKGYLVVQELVVTDGLEIEAPEITSAGLEEVPQNELDSLYQSTYQKVFGTN